MPSRPFIELGGSLGGFRPALIGPTVTVQGIHGSHGLQAKLEGYAKQFGSPGRFLRAAAFTYRNFMVENYLSGQRLRRRTGRLASAWQPVRLSRTEYLLTPGALGYSRVHEFGIDYPQQPVRGYTTRSGRKVPLYLRHMKLRPRRYVRDTVVNAAPLVAKRLDEIAANILNGTTRGTGDD